MERQKRIFIGSSVESKGIAERLQKNLNGEYEVVLWYENFFSLGKHFYSELITKIITFDFAIMIGGVDDFVERMPDREVNKYSPRDNVYLEYGLFSGFLSANRVLFMIHKECTAASDLSGMSLAQYDSADEAVALAEKWIAEYPDRRIRFPEANVELLPVYGIAIGYYYNFLEPFIDVLFSANKEDLPYDKIILNICIPSFIIQNPQDYAKLFYGGNKLQLRMIDKYRIQEDPTSTDGILRLYDVPNTMVALFKTVDTIFGVSSIDNPDSIHAKHRTLESLEGIITNLLSKNVYIEGKCISLNSDEKRISVCITHF